MQFADTSVPCYSTFTSDSCHAVNHLVAKTFVDKETLVMLVGYSAAARQRPARKSFKRRLNEGSRIFHNHAEAPYKVPTPLNKIE